MEAKIKSRKSEIEKTTPIVNPNCTPECPDIILKTLDERDTRLIHTITVVVREELRPIKRFMRMALQNRMWLVAVTGILIMTIGVIAIIWYNLKNMM